MLMPSQGVRILVATKPVDFRKGHDGLAALVQSALAEDPFTGTVFVFRSKRADRMKILFWEFAPACVKRSKLSGGQFEARTGGAQRFGHGLQAAGRKHVHLAGDPRRGHDAEPCAVRSPVCRLGLAPCAIAGGAQTSCGRVTRPRE
ncbi:IS66 family insertion sequence element accessory protein TnpB [Leisingera sp. HS039]|nr:IS66 family insertion sequence element accessory protein TnpB [Leisingera sp. HS039]QBR35320.1 transposase [Leisingera sp. NJS201]QBR36413.1 transposase [Leisingera sp. NJS201]